MIEVELDGVLSIITGGTKKIKIRNASTILEAVKYLTEVYPETAGKFFNGQKLSSQIIVYVDGTDIRKLSGEQTALSTVSRIRILSALVGG